MKQKPALFFATVLFATLAVSLFSCKAEDPLLEPLVELENADIPGGEAGDQRIAELEKEIERYSEMVEEQVHANGQLMVYYRMLGIRYLERKLYGPAMEALQSAMEISPANPILHAYYAAAAAQSAKADYSGARRNQLLATAEAAYMRALEIDPNYADALYGLSVLLVFELGRPADALGYLNRLVTVRTRDMNAYFLRARVYASLGRVQDAAADYDTIIEESRDPLQQQKAQELHSQLLGGE